MASLHGPSTFRPRQAYTADPISPPPEPAHGQPFPSSPGLAYRARPVGPRMSASRGKPHPPGGIKMQRGEWKLLLAVCAVAVGVRFYRLGWPDSVVFDEVHFGKFASKYIKSQYYVDVHPPLAKLLITLAAFVSGYDGNFDFKDIGKLYESVPYVAMRSLPATLGVLLVPVTYLTLRALDCRTDTALLGSLFITFENGLITQSRHILLDSPLIFFTALTTLFWTGFCNENRAAAFTEGWWVWLTCVGLSLGAVVSCKWVGLFTIATIGLCTIRQLWLLLGDTKVSIRLWIRHFLARALCLIVVPALFYMAMFELHFLILSNSGDGDGFMSAEFQHTLNGKKMQDTYADVGVGSKVVMRHWNTNGGYLHSHDHTYPGGSKQQQITLYPHMDTNNDWRILNATWDASSPGYDHETQPFRALLNGDMIRLEHIITSKKLHSHDIRPPVSEVDFQNEVSGYGFPGFSGDANDNWIVEIAEGDKRDRESTKRVRTLRTLFKLRHALTGCYLFSHKVKLPDWGYEQQEVTCNKNAVRANSLWFVEWNEHEKLPLTSPKVNYRKPGFISKFLELQKVMWTTNAGLTERHAFDSRPTSWPLLRRGINFWVKDHRQIYLLGNPVVWYLSTLAVVLYLSARGLLILRAKRGYKDFNNSGLVFYDNVCGFLVLGWALHYFPFYLMARQLFLHHYFPALWFAVLLTAAVYDLATARLKPRYRVQVALVLVGLAVWTYWHFNPLAYGGQWTKGKCESSKWLKTWDFSCGDFPQSVSDRSCPMGVADQKQYGDYVTGASAKPTPPRVTMVADAHQPGHIPQQNVAEPSAEQSATLATAESVGNVPQPGRDVFQDHPDVIQPLSASSSAKPEVGPQERPETSKAADPEEAAVEAATEAPPPLPANEPENSSPDADAETLD
ncbi:glycosyltransferase family 39 protein [Calocera viscosa TUFC12733]|uniref:Dolichyl-phosphate-mannose--protein mannosyltransferase n=1 Tax=Calocera viscosa (strain TUFC12733) TaxID=1330018 RepID=A0A167JPP1_CALVF|nr:glycosyltransferase family 39 protein [Calocera viscosa TUFC12733]